MTSLRTLGTDEDRRQHQATMHFNKMSNRRGRSQPGSSGLFADARSFASALPEHDDYLRGVVWAVVRDPNAVDDVMQAAYERAYRSLDRFDGRSSLRTWLHTICYRAAVDHIRYESSRPSVSLEATETEAPMAARASVTDEVVAGMEATDLLDRLEPEQRVLLYLTAGLAYSYDEVAEMVGISRGTVASRVSRAKDRLRNGRTT